MNGRPVTASPQREDAVTPRLDGVYAASVVVGVAAGVLLTPSAGVAAFTLVLVCGSLLRHGEPPVLAAAFGYQWLFVVTPVLFVAFVGHPPQYRRLGNIEEAVWLSMGGFLCLAVGIHLAFREMRIGEAVRRLWIGLSTEEYRVGVLCWIIVPLYSVDWVLELLPKSIFFNAAQWITGALAFRDVLLLTLWSVIFRRGSGYRYGLLALIVAMVPRFASKQTAFKEPLFMLVVMALTYVLVPKTAGEEPRRRAGRLAVGVAGAVVLLGVIGIGWEGAVKPAWRHLPVSGSPLEKVETFVRVASGATETLGSDFGRAAESLASRFSASAYFGLVLDRVPQLVPHADGELLRQAVWHVTHPRFLFPDKPNLGSGNEIAETYAGVAIGRNTSVSIGYMAEFYVDFGIPGMYIPLLLYGALLGSVYVLFARVAPSFDMFAAGVTVLYVNHFFGYESTFIKSLGGFLANAVVFLVLLKFVGPRLHRLLVTRAPRVPNRAPGVRRW